jgi:hypothetical protein
MYTKLKELFGRKTPSVKMFKSLLENLPEPEQELYKKAAVDTAFCDWENTPPLPLISDRLISTPLAKIIGFSII